MTVKKINENVSVEVVWDNPINEPNVINSALMAFLPRILKERVLSGKNMFDVSFAGYSEAYKKKLTAMGENTNVDFWVTGGLMKDIKTEAERSQYAAQVRMFVGTATSPQVKAPSKGKPRAQRVASGATSKGTARSTRSPPHNLVASWLHYGDKKHPARHWFGLSKTDIEKVTKEIEQYILAKTATRPRLG